MKKILLFLIAVFRISTGYSQSSTFDSAYIFLSSNVYEYKNPTFENKYDPYNYNYTERLIYERHNDSVSDLIVRYYTFNSEGQDLTIVSDGNKNINPSFSGNMAVWQSNKFGKQDLFYSIYNGSNWSQPRVVDTTSGDKINPNIHFTEYLDIYCLSFQKNDDIYFRYYKDGHWSADTNLTSNISQRCHSPLMWGRYYNMSILFIKELSDSTNVVVKQPLYVNYPTYEIIFLPANDLFQSGFIKNHRLSVGLGEEYLNFEKDSSQFTNTFGYPLSFGNQTINFTSQFGGRNTNGRGSACAFVFENDFLYNYFFAFGFVRKSADSTTVVAYGLKNNQNLISREFYLGDSSISTYLNISRPVISSSLGFKIRLIWEQLLNGKIALMQSNFIDFITSVDNNGVQFKNFYLYQNYPNPFNPSTVIKFSIPNTQYTILRVYDALGKEVVTLVNENLNAGSYEAEFNGSNYSSGIYFYKLEAGDFSEVKRMVLLK